MTYVFENRDIKTNDYLKGKEIRKLEAIYGKLLGVTGKQGYVSCYYKHNHMPVNELWVFKK